MDIVREKLLLVTIGTFNRVKQMASVDSLPQYSCFNNQPCYYHALKHVPTPDKFFALVIYFIYILFFLFVQHHLCKW